jgi:signal-transduction protein with cAMP-binding, CBS, and nucleotidyltransferase domain
MISKRDFQSAKQVMRKKMVFIDGMATAKEAVELMKKENVQALIVKKRNELDAYGIVIVHDLINGVIIPEKTSEEVNVFEIMTKPAIWVPSNMDIHYVARLLMKIGIREAPVEENGELIGMISLSDIILDNMLF